MFRCQCSLCKRSKDAKSTSTASTQSSDRDQRPRSRSKKLTPDIKPLHGHSNYRVRSSGAGVTANHREGHDPSPRNDGVDALPGNYRTATSSTVSKTRWPRSPRFDADAGDRRSATLPASSRRMGTKSTGRPDSATARTGAYYRGAEGGAVVGATVGAEETNESMIHTILNQHGSGRQTAEQIEETQKLINQMLGTEQAPSSGRSREKGYRSSRRTQSIDRGNKKTRDRDVPLDTYNLHSDGRVDERIKSDEQRCTVCYSRRDLTLRKDCEHFICGSCYRI